MEDSPESRSFVWSNRLPDDDAKKWTNADVVRWLLEIDQKLFIPAVITLNISGKTLLEFELASLHEAVNQTSALPPVAEVSVKTLWNHVEQLRGSPLNQTIAEEWGEKIDEDETYGRLLQHPSGWTFDREYNEWVDYLELSGEYAVSVWVMARLKEKTNNYQLVILLISAVSSIVSSVKMAEAGSSASKDSNVKLAGSTVLLCTTFLATLVSGYVQFKGPQWKEQLDEIRKYQSYAEQLISLYEDNLSSPLPDRLRYDDYNARVKKLWSDIALVRLDFSPMQRNKAMRDIKENDPTTYKKVFEFQEDHKPYCCFPGEIELSEPVGDKYDWMLMRFSGEDMGEYTTKPDIFKKDKDDAREGLYKLRMSAGTLTKEDTDERTPLNRPSKARQTGRYEYEPGWEVDTSRSPSK